ncbi:hypothetical protein MBGDN05_00566 [Thermoplasmatales archaeon SCGC AB-539-N05]|nr:hypothetical protein MBGDN05_00566 [Thermoplasmatales archaeon SCGC AB-539-N05]
MKNKSPIMATMLAILLFTSIILLTCSVDAKRGELLSSLKEKINDNIDKLKDLFKNDDAQVDQQNVEEMTDILGGEKKLNVNHTEEVNEGKNFTVQVTDNDGKPVSNVNVWFRLDRYITDEFGEVKILAPDVDEDEDLLILVQKFLYGSSSSKITVLNVDTKLYLVFPPGVSSKEKFEVFILNGNDERIDNVTVSFDNLPKDTNENGSVTFEAPDVTHDESREINASKLGFEPTSESITVTPKESGVLGFLVGNLLLISVIIGIISVAIVAAWKYKQHYWY